VQAVTFTGAGGNEVVEVTERPDPEPLGEEVLVRVRYAGVNPADVQQRDGRYPAPPGVVADIPGLEVAGVVIACGPRVQAWQPGDRVFGLVAGGGLADRVVVHERCVTRVPEQLDEPSAAAVPEAFITAHDAVRTQAQLTMGETLLVHGATGGVGSAAVQIGLTAGARVLAVARSEEGRDFVAKLGAEPVVDDGFQDTVAELTGGRGADVILELVGAPHFPANIEAVAVKGRIVVVGVGAGTSAEMPLLRLMQKRAVVRGTVLRARPVEEKGTVLRAFEREVVPHLASVRVTPVIDEVFPAANAADAFTHLEGAGKRGKVLLQFED